MQLDKLPDTVSASVETYANLISARHGLTASDTDRLRKVIRNLTQYAYNLGLVDGLRQAVKHIDEVV